MSLDADTILKHQSVLASERSNFETWWQEIAYRVMPQEAQFTTTSAEGEKRTERLFDSTAAMANERFAAVMEDLLTGRTQLWHGLKPPAKYGELMEIQAVRAWYEHARDVLFQMRYSPRANFASQKQQGYESLGAFGNSCLFIDEKVGDRAAPARYIACHMREIFWAEDQYGRIDTVYRRFELDGRRAIQRFGDKLGTKLKAQCEKDPFKRFEFIHCVKPNEERKPERLDYRGMPWASYFVSCSERSVIDAGGYTSWPYAIGRYKVGTRERYGRGPAMLCWPAILTMQEQKKTVLRAGQLEVHPPVLLTEEGILGGEGFSLRSGALNYGALSDRGEELAKPFKTGANVPLGAELLAMERADVRDAFLQTIFEVLVENPQMTATQVLEIAQQRGVLLAPAMGRQHSEDLGPLIEREIDIAAKAGLLPPMPPELEEIEGEYEVEYTSPLARAMRAQDALAIARTFEMLPSAIAIDKTAAYVIDVPASIRELAEINGMPAKLVRDKKAVDEITADNAEAEQTMQAAELAPGISQAALNAAKAEELRASS
jgi:hypothetical protein